MIAVYMYAAKALSNKVNRFWTTNRKQKVLGAKKSCQFFTGSTY